MGERDQKKPLREQLLNSLFFDTGDVDSETGGVEILERALDERLMAIYRDRRPAPVGGAWARVREVWTNANNRLLDFIELWSRSEELAKDEFSSEQKVHQVGSLRFPAIERVVELMQRCNVRFPRIAEAVARIRTANFASHELIGALGVVESEGDSISHDRAHGYLVMLRREIIRNDREDLLLPEKEPPG